MMGMIGHASAGPLRACVKICDCYDPFSTGTLTRVKTIETCVENAFCYRTRAIRTSGLFLFVLVRAIRSSLHCIKSLSQRSLITSLKVVNYPAVRNQVRVRIIYDSDLR
jgi:hypothetical protein